MSVGIMVRAWMSLSGYASRFCLDNETLHFSRFY